MTAEPTTTRPPRAGGSYSAGLVFSLSSFAVIGVLTLITSVLSARLYGIKVTGQAALALAPVAIVTLLSTVREQPSMVRQLAKLEPRHPRASGIVLAVFAFSFTLTVIVAGLGVVVCYLAFNGPLNNPPLFAPAAAALAGYVLIINTCWNIDGVFGAFRAGRELFVVRLNQAALYGVLLVALTYVTHSVWGLILAFLGSWLTSLLHRLVLLTRVLSLRVPIADVRAGFATLREIVSFGLKLTPGSLATGFSEASGTWILGVTTSVSVVGAYSRAWTFATRLTELNWRITEMLLPTLVQHRHAGNNDAFERVLTDSLRYAAFGLLLPAAVGGGAATAVMHIFGAGFTSAAPALRLLLFVPLLQTLTAIQGTALMAYDRPLLTAAAQGVRLLVTVAAGVVLTVAFGVTGMALAMAAGALVSFGVYVALLRIRAGISTGSLMRYRQLGGLAAGYAGGFAASHLAEGAVPGAPGLLIALAAGSVSYVVLAIGVSGTTHRDRARAKLALNTITSHRFASAGVSGTA